MEDIGQVYITVKEGRSLALSEPTDVYCIIQLEQQKVRTSVCSRVPPGGRAEWNEGYTFDVTTDADISIKLWGKNPSAPKGRLLGSITIPASASKNRAPVETWKVLAPPPGSSTPSGELFYRTSYVNSTSKVGFEDFTILKLIGKGAFGRVMLVRKNDTGRLYAMKQLAKDHVLSLAAVTFTLTERNVLKTYNHPFVVSLKYSFQTKGHLYMVLDYVGGGELFYHMAERGVFDEDTVRFYAAQVVLALGFLHDHGVTYRDLKPENLLLDIHGNICLCDFGLCKEQVDGENTYTLCGSPEYMAPEVLQGKGYGKSVDWWALGILIYEMLTGLPPFYSEDPVEMGQNILTAPIHFPDHLSKNIMGLIVQLLRRDPARRLGSGPNDAEDIKAHPFFASVEWKKIIRKEIEPPFKPHLTGNLDVTYFDPNCTEAPVVSEEIRASPNTSDPEDCFAQFSFVAPSDFGSTPHFGTTPHQLRKLAASPAPLSFGHLGALHSSSPVLSSSHSSHNFHSNLTQSQPTPSSSSSSTSSNHLGGGGIPRSQGNFALSNLSTSRSPHSHSSHSPSPSPRGGSFTLDEAGEREVLTRRDSSEILQFISDPALPPHHANPLHSSQPLPSTHNPLRNFHPLIPSNNISPSPATKPQVSPTLSRRAETSAHPLRDIPYPAHPPDYEDPLFSLPPHPVEDNNGFSSSTTTWTPTTPSHHPPHSLSSPVISPSSRSPSPTSSASPSPSSGSTPSPVTPSPKQPRPIRMPLAASASSPDLLRLVREPQSPQSGDDNKDKKDKKFGFMSLFRKIK